MISSNYVEELQEGYFLFYHLCDKLIISTARIDP